MSGQTSVAAILTHALVFTLVLYGIKQYYILNSPKKEGFSGEKYTDMNWRGLALSAIFFMGLSFGIVVGNLIKEGDITSSMPVYIGGLMFVIGGGIIGIAQTF
jgi:hypothetical protein